MRGQTDLTREGWSTQEAADLVGVTYRQLDHWTRTRLVVPTIQEATGSGSKRTYSFRDIVLLRTIRAFRAQGISLSNLRAAIESLRARGIEDLSSVTLYCDGTTVYHVTTAEEVIDLLRGNQQAFRFALRNVVEQAAADIANLPAPRVRSHTPISAAV